MNIKHKRIAFYGKGGIGKSTIAANVSAVLSKIGKKVLHIGCDPKSDSTRILMKRRIPTVLKTLKEKGDALNKEDIMFTGVYGVTCVEAGGPEPGIGCAGMGISAVIETLERLEVFDMDWDLIVYDVLGDVVCGGFSIPMRKQCVDAVYIVTSSEFMSLYAANNILKGISHYETPQQKLFGGFIHNRWASKTDKAVVDHFIQMTESRLIASIEQNQAIKMAEYERNTIIEANPQAPISQVIETLGKDLFREPLASDSCPLDDEAMEALFDFVSAKNQEISR
ncbi:AAA family ATPase [Acetobacterium bakii]|uniref:nitrogenase n=1 Tax=Acetobacterium bakii TaxID=52689 RepID=A0A0L6TWV9_9FIRM|nr:nitrogenase iron protein NifH [Acetobacterium bakii]KNZ40738.1 nitrogenase iron protein [Acetobacterium bakii]